MQLLPFRTRPDLRLRLAKRLPDLLGMTLEQVTSEVPYYQHISPDEVQNDVALVTARNLQLFVTLLLDGTLPAREDFELLMRSAAGRAEERIPLPEVLAAYFAGFRACWQELRQVADAGDDIESVLEIGGLVLAYLQVVTMAVTDSYLETTSALAGRDREARSALLSAVITASDEEPHWRDAGLSPWTERTVVCLRVRPPRNHDELRTAVEARRRARTIRDHLADVSGATVLDALGPTGGIVVLRGDVDPGTVRTALGRAVRGRWHAGVASAADREATPAALVEAEACADVGDRLRRRSGVHLLAEVMMEVQVTRPGPARDALERLLEPLADHPELEETLSAYLSAGARRTEAARVLHVHPNTLDYRLRRVADLTGIDPADRVAGEQLRWALVVRQYLASGG